MGSIDFRDYHGYIRHHPAGAVVADNGDVRLGVGFFQSPRFLFGHGNSAENKIHQMFDAADIRRVHHHHILDALGQGKGHRPAACQRFLIAHASASAAGGKNGDVKPGMLMQQTDKTLAYHAGSADDANTPFLHVYIRLLRIFPDGPQAELRRLQGGHVLGLVLLHHKPLHFGFLPGFQQGLHILHAVSEGAEGKGGFC